jgi:hypothetical protein
MRFQTLQECTVRAFAKCGYRSTKLLDIALGMECLCQFRKQRVQNLQFDKQEMKTSQVKVIFLFYIDHLISALFFLIE